MDKRKVLSKLLPMIVLVSLSIAAGVTGAAVIHSMQLENPIKTPVVEGGITEKLDQGAKEVSFTNNGEAAVTSPLDQTFSVIYSADTAR